MKKHLVFMLCALMLFTVASAGAETLRVGMECDYAPFNWTQSEASPWSVPLSAGGHADGYDVQIARFIATGLDMDLEIVKTEWDGLPLALTSGKIDAIIAGMSPTAERKFTIDFTDSYYDSDLVIVVRGDSAFAQAAKLSDFAGARITAQLNTFHYTVIDQIPGVIKETALETFPAMIVALASGRIDGYVSERPGAVSALAANPGFSFVSFSEGEGFETLAEDTSVAVGLRKGSELKDTINMILDALDKETRLEMMDAAIERQPLSE